jgi:hypothetical protein
MSHYKNAPMSVKLFLLVLLLAGMQSFAASENNGKGGYDAPYFQADFTQDLTDWSSALVNPALLYRVNQIHIDFFGAYRWSLFDDENMGYQHLGIMVPIRRNHTIGGTLLFGGGTIKKTSFRENTFGNNTIQLEGNARYQDIWPIGSYGIRILPWMMLGTNLKYRIQNRFSEVKYANFPGFDLGIYLNHLIIIDLVM